MTGEAKLKIFADQCVPDSAARTFEKAGHETQFLRMAIAVRTPDPIVAAVAMANRAILLSVDNDFLQIARGAGFSKSKAKKLHLIKISCRPARAAERLEAAMSFIENEWALFLRGGMPRLFIEVSDGFVKSNR
ncbi:DUF5615 family PIN-like protein [Lichenicola cladoniae]|uniref:DUF5615 family PIN-like protein n=1 Tax=Lichenicola cladoniae TaxID=1484109 RepID=A0A6M8HU87_9PROT|nr:DUF5615 family PIN-like protein [Lichenicola cladoniae]NPD68280.1 DUF5615 family PIN-like protein [Acetobacteraceae bacterium]QKE91880.1 DUF5615 family PIN-like protein [Lichenicola cladoniae]